MFKGETPEGETVFAYIGGDADDIYRLDLDYNETGTISNLEPSSIRIMKGEEVVVDCARADALRSRGAGRRVLGGRQFDADRRRV